MSSKKTYWARKVIGSFEKRAPDVNSVPRQAERAWLMENGYVISGFQLQKECSACVVEACLREAFEEKISVGTCSEDSHACS